MYMEVCGDQTRLSLLVHLLLQVNWVITCLCIQVIDKGSACKPYMPFNFVLGFNSNSPYEFHTALHRHFNTCNRWIIIIIISASNLDC